MVENFGESITTEFGAQSYPTWDSKGTYVQYQRVQHKGLTYGAKKTSTGQEPSKDSEYWELLGSLPVEQCNGHDTVVFTTGDKVQNISGKSVNSGKGISVDKNQVSNTINANTDDETVKVNDSNKLYVPTASADNLGVVKAGENITIAEDGTISASGGSGDDHFTVETVDNTKVLKTTGAILPVDWGTGLLATVAYECEATGDYSHAEGVESKATGFSSHAEGAVTEANGDNSHAEGEYTEANGIDSHAEGSLSVVNGNCSHVEGEGTVCDVNYQHVQGLFNIKDTGPSTTSYSKYAGKYAYIVGNGTNEDNRSNAHTLDWKGNSWYAGDVTATDSTGASHNLTEKANAGWETISSTTTGGMANFNVNCYKNDGFILVNCYPSADTTVSENGTVTIDLKNAFLKSDTETYIVPQMFFNPTFSNYFKTSIKLVDDKTVLTMEVSTSFEFNTTQKISYLIPYIEL